MVSKFGSIEGIDEHIDVTGRYVQFSARARDGREGPRCSGAFWRWMMNFDVGTGFGSRTRGKREKER